MIRFKKILGSLLLLVSVVGAKDIYATFDVNAQKSANLAFDTSGTIEAIYADVSSVVHKGDRLVKLKNNEQKALLEIAKRSLENARIAMKYAKKDYERHLKIKNIIDEEKFDKFESAYEKALVAFEIARVNVEYKQILFEKTTLYAPFDGTIFEKSVEVGDVVSGMMLRTIFRIQTTSKRKLILEFDQKYHQDVKEGQTFVYSVDGDPKHYSGKISKIYPIVDAKNRKIKAEVEVDDLIVGLFGDGYIQVPALK